MTAKNSVFHKRLGWGTVLRVVERGSKKGAWVDFGFMKEFVNVDDLDLRDNHSIQKMQAIEPTFSEPIKSIDKDQDTNISDKKKGSNFHCSENDTTISRKGIFALKLGQILESHVFQLSVGTEDLQDTLENAVNKVHRGSNRFIMIDGAWGGGKTHALTLLQAIARKARFATTSVVMDGDAITLSEPMRLMEEILNSFRLPGRNNSDQIMDLIRNIMRKEKLPEIRMKGARVIAEALNKIPREAFNDPDALGLVQDYLSLSLSASQAKFRMRELGYGHVSFLTLRANRVDMRGEAFSSLLTNWAHLLSAMGAGGLLVLFDELDVEYASTAYGDKASLNKRIRRNNFLKYLRKLSDSKVPLIIAFASAPGGPDVDRENDAVEDIKSFFQADLIYLKVPSPDDKSLLKMMENLLALYAQAYPDDYCSKHEKGIAEKLFKSILLRYRNSPSAVPRQFVRTTLETLDHISGCNMPCDEIIQLLRE